MKASTGALPTELPSRAPLLGSAREALGHHQPVIITGTAGSGRSTFARTLLAGLSEQNVTAHRILGSPALATTPFACVAALAAQLPTDLPDTSAADTIAVLARWAARTPHALLIDHAEYVDSASAAAIAQLHGHLRIIITTGRLADLPQGFHDLAYSDSAHTIHLDDIDIHDARMLLDDLVGDPFHSSAVNRLFNASGGNPLHLRELAIDAHSSGALPVIRGYRTLLEGWTPKSRRLQDFVARRIANLPADVRRAIELLAITGPLPRGLATTVITPETFEAAIAHAVVIVSARNPRLDIAQSFDGPGAESVLRHPEELVQLGAGLTAELVLATLTAGELDAHRTALDHAFTGMAVPTTVRLHMRQLPTDEHETAAVHDRAAAHTAALNHTAEQVIDRVLRGLPDEGIELFTATVDTEAWHAASSAAQTTLIQAMFLAMMAEGSRPDTFDHAFTTINWHDLALDHVVFLTGRAALFLELGDAAQAQQLFTQALALAAADTATEPHPLTGFAYGLDAAAAVMTGDTSRAARSYHLFCAAPATSGGLARWEVERATIAVIMALEGPDAARRRHAELIAAARNNGHSYLVMRLLHDAWRLRLIDGAAARVELSTAAQAVRGTLARTLEQYAAAWAALHDDALAASSPSVDDLVVHHLSTGRMLFAGELASRAAHATHERGDRRRALQLLALFGETLPGIPGVTTPSLGRARLDPGIVSEREIEVCTQAAAGKSNADIAAELYLSPRTVEGHLQRAYSKLGIIDRRQLLVAANDSVNSVH